MIETQEALDNLDAILSTPGLDAIYVGPSDLSISLGYAPGGDKPDEWMMTALKKVLDGCKRHKVQPGIHCGAPSYAKKMIEMGFTFVTVGGDNVMIWAAGRSRRDEGRAETRRQLQPGQFTHRFARHPLRIAERGGPSRQRWEG
jgi:4-hydroxy-2-oxoheptanedioate aldolase